MGQIIPETPPDYDITQIIDGFSGWRILQVALAATLFTASAGALAQSYPSKPIRWIVPLAVGGPNDLVTRAVAHQLVTSLGQPVIVDNRPGAGGISGTDAVAKSPADGYTLLTTNGGAMVFHKMVYPKLPYDPQRDFAPVSLMAKSFVALFVHESVPARTVKELVEFLKANPGKMNYGSSGIGTPFHLAMERFLHSTQTSAVHIPYKGAGQFIPEFLAGRIDMVFFPVVDQLVAQVKTGKLRALAAATATSIPVLPQVPTFTEVGMADMIVPSWIAVVVPAATPRAIIDRLNREIAKGVASPEVLKLYTQINYVQATSSPDEFARFIQKEIDTWGGLIKSLGITAE